MKIAKARALFLHRDLPFHGGVSKSFLYYARHRDPDRVKMWVGCLSEPSVVMVEELKKVSTSVLFLGDNGYILPSCKLHHFLKRQSVNLVICGSFKSYLVAKLASWRTSCAVIFWIPGNSQIIFGEVRKWIFRNLAHNDTLIFISESVQRTHTFPSHKGKQYVIYYGIKDPNGVFEPSPYSEKERIAFGYKPKDLLIGYTAEFTEWKDHATLISAFNRVSNRFQNLHLLLIGTGKLLEKIKASSAVLECSQKIHFLGARIDARQVLGLLDIYVHPSRGEGFGLSVVEAMLAGLPVIVSNEGAFPEYVNDGITGFVYPAGNDEALANIIIKILQNRPLAKHIAEAGRVDCLRRFSTGRFVSEMTFVLEREIN